MRLKPQFSRAEVRLMAATMATAPRSVAGTWARRVMTRWTGRAVATT